MEGFFQPNGIEFVGTTMLQTKIQVWMDILEDKILSMATFSVELGFYGHHCGSCGHELYVERGNLMWICNYVCKSNCFSANII